MGILNENGGGFYMPVAPAGYGSNGGGLFGGDGSIWGLLLVLLLCGNGMWGGFGGGMMAPFMMGGMAGGMGLDFLYPWLNNSQHISDGFRDQQLQTSIGALQNSVTSGFGDVQLGIAGVNQNICQTGSGSFQHYDLHTGGDGGAGKRWRGRHRGGALHLPVRQRQHPERQHTGDPGAKRKYRL